MPKPRVLVTGAGGFIGHHLVRLLVAEGYWVRGVDIEMPKFESTPAHEFELLDLRIDESCRKAMRDVQWVFNLAANMGGIGFIESNRAVIMRDNALININTLEAAREAEIERFLFTSSACVYPGYLQDRTDVSPLREEDAYPADAEDGYGWEKLWTERLCRHYLEDFDLATCVVRFHNIYGPLGTYDGGKEKSPAAICRKIAQAEDDSAIEVWGDGEQTRSYCYIDDCVEGIHRIMLSGHHDPINLGTDRLVTINQLVDIVASIAGKSIAKLHDISKPQGVRGRNADLTKMREVLGWEPRIGLESGLSRTYEWIASQVASAGRT